MEFFPFDEQVGKKNEFSKEAVIFKKKSVANNGYK